MADGPWDNYTLPERRTPEGYPYYQVGDTPVRTPQQPWDKYGAQAQAPPEGAPWQKYVDKALEPITSYPEAYKKTREEAQSQVSTGAKQLFGRESSGGMGEKYFGKTAAGLGNMALGAARFVGSPIEAGIHTVVGKPLEENLGIPHDYSEFAAGLALPGYGLARMPGTQAATKTVEKIFSPTTVSPVAGDAEAAIRSAGGRAARDTATTADMVEPFRAAVNRMDEPQRLKLFDFMEGRSTGPLANPQAGPLANTLRDAFQLRRTKLENLPSTSQMNFVEEYFPHMWKDPQKAKDWLAGMGGRQGSGRNLKERVLPTIADGLKAGLELATTDPIAATMRYVENMDRFIALNEVVDTAKSLGTVKRFPPGQAPAGWVPLQGRLAGDSVMGLNHAPEDWARVYNNYVSRGIHGIGTGEYGTAYDTMRRGSNAITALELGLSGYHALTMAQEGMVNGVAKGVNELASGRPVATFKELARAPGAPVSLMLTGRKLQNVYLGRAPGTAEMKQITDLLTEAGGRARGFRHSPDYEFSGMGSYVTSFRRAALKMELAADYGEMTARPIAGTAKVAARHVGRIMQTVAQPLFEKYVPMVKNGAFYENMAQWLKANPNATREQQIAAARQQWDSIDNRFGEMVQDNVFWDKTLKQVAMLLLRSWSWTVGGSVREIGGGIKDFGAAFGRGDKWTPRASYVIALPITYGALSAVYQYLKTGQAPQDMRDLLAPRTGGVDANSGEPERLLMPGYMKDVFGFVEHPQQEIANKVATGPRMAKELFFNENWRGDPIFAPRGEEGNIPAWLLQFGKYLSENVGPITLRNLQRGQKTGSNLGAIESMLGVRTAPRQFIDPEGYEKMLGAIKGRKWRGKERYERRQEQRYGGPVE